jgi:hypothetical protein
MTPHPISLSILTVALALVASAGQALAGDDAGAATRASVKASVLEARANGQLRPAGEATEPFAATSAGASRSARDVREETLLARAQGALVPAGEGSPVVAPSGTQLARAEVKESTRLARLNNELVPAGEGVGPTDRMARAPARGGATFALVRR